MRSWIATIFFLIVTILLSIVSIPAAAFDRSGRSYLWLARFWSKSFLLLYGIKVKVSGAANIRRGIPTVYIANHSSYTDIPVILAHVPDDIRLILRDSLTRIPIWGWALKVSPFLVMSRESAAKAKAALDKATQTIHNGAAVLLFPEGTRTSDGTMQEFKRGAFKLALESEAVVVPIVLKGTYEVLPRTGSLPKTGRSVELSIGIPIALPSERGRAAELALMHQAEAQMREMLL
jgi:1-acyl-sn-glycerol-3-phosphate acyltransferase